MLLVYWYTHVYYALITTAACKTIMATSYVVLPRSTAARTIVSCAFAGTLFTEMCATITARTAAISTALYCPDRI